MLKKILRFVLILAIVVIGGGFLMPGTSHVERQTDINAPAAVVFDQLNELKNWNNWSPWAKLDPNVKMTYSQPSSAGIGAFYTWASQQSNVGEGKMTILDAKPNELLHYRMDFKGANEAFADFRLTAKDSTSTHLVWTFDTDHGLNPISRWFGLMFEKLIAPDYEKGLATLKANLEKH